LVQKFVPSSHCKIIPLFLFRGSKALILSLKVAYDMADFFLHPDMYEEVDPGEKPYGSASALIFRLGGWVITHKNIGNICQQQKTILRFRKHRSNHVSCEFLPKMSDL
jgi:hypothetical protein